MCVCVAYDLAHLVLAFKVPAEMHRKRRALMLFFMKHLADKEVTEGREWGHIADMHT